MKNIKTLIEREFDAFFEFETDNRDVVTSTSAKLFAEHVARLYAESKPESDVSALVEALSALRGCIMETRGPDAHSALVLADAALAAHRRQGGEV